MADENLCTLHDGSSIVGESGLMKRLYGLVERLAKLPTKVLITGETGTGKELVARALHDLGGMDRPFVTVNCSAIPENLVESILFGHRKGSFTSACDNRKGLLSEATGGTFFLDEIADLSLDSQAKVLRVLQEGEYNTVGETRTKKVDTRFVAATNKDLEGMIRRGDFREDLYYRLNVFRLEIPPLRNRLDDIVPLAIHFVEKFNRSYGIEISTITPQAFKKLRGYSWPGNVRELENVIERAFVLAEDDMLRPKNLLIDNPSGWVLEPAKEAVAAPVTEIVSEPLKKVDAGPVGDGSMRVPVPSYEASWWAGKKVLPAIWKDDLKHFVSRNKVYVEKTGFDKGSDRIAYLTEDALIGRPDGREYQKVRQKINQSRFCPDIPFKFFATSDITKMRHGLNDRSQIRRVAQQARAYLLKGYMTCYCLTEQNMRYFVTSEAWRRLGDEAVVGFRDQILSSYARFLAYRP